MKEILTEAIVLEKNPIGEADANISIYTKEMGKIITPAKGVRKTTAKFSHHLEPINLIDCLLLINRQTQLKGVLTKNRFSNIRHNETTLFSAIKSLGILNRAIILPEKDEIIWQKIVNFLKLLDVLSQEENDKNKFFVFSAQLYFLIKIAQQLGVLPDIENFKKDFGSKDYLALSEIYQGNNFKNLNWKKIMVADIENIEKKIINIFDNIY